MAELQERGSCAASEMQPGAASHELTKFSFRGDELDVIPSDGTIHISIRRVCESLGVDVENQRKKLQSAPSISTVLITVQMPGDDQRREIGGSHG
jgi:hypothetical protein